MSEIRVNKVINEAGTGSVELTQGATLPSGKTISGAGSLNLSGVATAMQFSGNITGVAATFTGNVSIGGTLTYDDVTNIDSVGLITARNGINVTGGITTSSVDVKAALETVSVASTSPANGDSTKVTLECDVSNGTVFTHDLSSGSVGIVSIKNFPVSKNSFHTVAILFTQNSAGTANTTAATGIGTYITLNPTNVSGFSTSARVGSATTITLSTTGSDIDVVTFGIHYNGSGSGSNSNYTTFATKNGGLRLGNIRP